MTVDSGAPECYNHFDNVNGSENVHFLKTHMGTGARLPGLAPVVERIVRLAQGDLYVLAFLFLYTQSASIRIGAMRAPVAA
jgi:hypothetical protein